MWPYRLLLDFSTACSGPKPFKRPFASDSNEMYETFESFDRDWNSLNQTLKCRASDMRFQRHFISNKVVQT